MGIKSFSNDIYQKISVPFIYFQASLSQTYKNFFTDDVKSGLFVSFCQFLTLKKVAIYNCFCSSRKVARDCSSDGKSKTPLRSLDTSPINSVIYHLPEKPKLISPSYPKCENRYRRFSHDNYRRVKSNYNWRDA